MDLLDAEEEIRLAQAIEAGRAAAQRLATEGVEAPEERARLQEVIAAGRAGRERFVRANLRLVVHIASRQTRTVGVDLADIIQDGNLGLLTAVDRFDWRRGYRFSTYAAWWIRQGIQRGTVSASRIIRLPYPIHDALSRIAAARERLQVMNGREPSLRELALATRLDVHLVERALQTRPDALSLHRPFGGQEGSPDLGEFLAVSEDRPAEEATERVYQAAVRHVAATQLDERSWQVLCLRFGLDGGEPLAYSAIGAEVGLSRESIRLILKRALAVLRVALSEGEVTEDCRPRLPRRRHGEPVALSGATRDRLARGLRPG